MVIGSVPVAFFGAYLLHVLGNSKTAQKNIELSARRGAADRCRGDGAALRVDRRGGHDARRRRMTFVARPIPTVLLGVLGGVIVGMTSVGSGSLMIVILLFLYPRSAPTSSSAPT